MLFACFFSVALCVGGDYDDLAKKLGHPNYLVRNKFHNQLLQSTDFSLYVKLREIKTTDAEVNGRKKLIMENFEEKLYQRLRPIYKVDLLWSPKYPWIIQGLPHDYQWRGVSRSEIVTRYLARVPMPGDFADNFPDFPRHRQANELWTEDRMRFALSDALVFVKSEDEVCTAMQSCMEAINKDMAIMVAEEDSSWRHMQRKNPLRATQKNKR